MYPMSETILRLDNLIEGSSEYDEDFQKPTQEAYSAARQMIEDAQSDITSVDQVLKASPAAIGDGGIFIQWGNVDNYVRLLIPANPRDAYIFRKRPDSCEIIKELNGLILSHQLCELASIR